MIGGHKTRVDNNPDRVRIDDISKALKNSKILDYKKEVKPIIDKLSSSNFLKNINSDWTIGDVENSIQSNSMLRSPKTDAFSLIYCGIEDGYRASKQPFNYSLDDITDMFDGNMDCMEKAFEILARAMGDGNEKKPKAKRVKKS